MKIKGAVITGLVFIALGSGVAVYGAYREDFDMDKLYEEVNLEAKSYDASREINSISYNGYFEDLKIIKSEEVNNITLKYSESDVRTYTVGEKDGSLIINQKYKKKWIYKLNNIRGDYKFAFEILVPKELESISVDLNAGLIETSNLNSNSLDYSVNAGQIELTNVVSNTIKCEMNAGEISIDNVTASTFEGSVDAGEIMYDGIINSSFYGEVKCGNIELTLYQNEEDFTCNGVGTGKISITTKVNVGDSEISFK